ncbi:hypothetical protein GCM10010415_74890 [Streptomyces atrovirens]
MSVRILTDPIGRLPWASPALPRAIHDVRAAREHGVVDALAAIGVEPGHGASKLVTASALSTRAAAKSSWRITKLVRYSS